MIKKVKQRLTREERIIEQRRELAKKGRVAAIWTRVSSADQYKKNFSIDTQREACIEYCKQNGIRIKKDDFGGKNESAKNAGELFLEMISEVGNDPEYNTIVVFDYDRFSRNSNDGIIYKTAMKKKGINVLSVNQPIDQNNVIAEQIENILIVVADIENAMRRHKCHDGMVACVNRGELYSRPPFGYDSKKVDKTHVITVNEKGKILKLAFEWIANEPEISQAEVLRRLAIRGLKMNKQKLSQCLHNCFYCGILEHKYLENGPIQGKQEPLISRELFDRVQKVLAGNYKGYEHAEETPRFPLKLHVYCAKDNHALTGYTVKKKGIDYYKCNGKGCKSNVSAKELHRKYRELLNSIDIPQEYRAITKMVLERKFAEKECENAKSRELIIKNLSTLETKLKTAKMRYVTEDTVNAIDYNEVKADLENRIAECKKELDKYEGYQSNLNKYIDITFEIASSLGSEWDKGNFKVCQKIQKLVFPDGVFWDNENRSYRTDGMNDFFSKLRLVHTSVEGYEQKEKDKSCDLSYLVAGGGLEPPTSGL